MPKPVREFRENVLFDSARLKVEWANHNIFALQAEMASFFEASHNRIEADLQTDSGKNVLMLYQELAVPPEINLRIGDIIHQLASALDHVYSEIILIFAQKRIERATFPSNETREQLVRSETVKEAVKKRVPRALIYDVIVDRIRPYKTGNTALWTLRKIDNIDKHRQILTVLKVATIPIIHALNAKKNVKFEYIDMVVGGGTKEPDTIFGPGFFGSDFKVEKHGKPTLDIVFNEPGLAEREPVLPTLFQYGEAVAAAINILSEDVFTRIKADPTRFPPT